MTFSTHRLFSGAVYSRFKVGRTGRLFPVLQGNRCTRGSFVSGLAGAKKSNMGRDPRTATQPAVIEKSRPTRKALSQRRQEKGGLPVK